MHVLPGMAQCGILVDSEGAEHKLGKAPLSPLWGIVPAQKTVTGAELQVLSSPLPIRSFFLRTKDPGTFKGLLVANVLILTPT